MKEEKLDRVEERIENQKQQKRRLKAFLDRLLRDKESKDLLGPWMAEIKEEKQGVQVSYLIEINDNGDIVDHRLVSQDQGKGGWDLNFSIKADPFVSYDRLRDAASQKVLSELDHIRREIKSNQEYRDALKGEVAV